MVRKLATCQCPRWPDTEPCSRTATAEDLLCDPCRTAKQGNPQACSQVAFGDAGPWGHVEAVLSG